MIRLSVFFLRFGCFRRDNIHFHLLLLFLLAFFQNNHNNNNDNRNNNVEQLKSKYQKKEKNYKSFRISVYYKDKDRNTGQDILTLIIFPGSVINYNRLFQTKKEWIPFFLKLE